MELEKLALVCIRNPARANMHAPWHLLVDGEPWTVATDGHRLVAVRGHVEGARPSNGKITNAHEMLALPSTSVEVRTDVLRAWAKGAADTRPCDCDGKAVKCDECRGTGGVECACDCGAASHDVDCEECAGTGRLDCDCVGGRVPAEKDPRHLLGRVYNRNLVPALLALAPEQVRAGLWPVLGQDHEALVLWGDDWRGVVMPLHGLSAAEHGDCPIGAAFTEDATVQP
ncbi:MAG: hypothetical protein WKG00_14925 [Polyangiaceae bacterium]